MKKGPKLLVQLLFLCLFLIIFSILTNQEAQALIDGCGGSEVCSRNGTTGYCPAAPNDSYTGQACAEEGCCYDNAGICGSDWRYCDGTLGTNSTDTRRYWGCPGCEGGGSPTGSISASPNPCYLTANNSICTSNISWNTSNTSTVRVCVKNSSVNTYDPFSSELIGSSEPATWIAPDKTYTFTIFNSGSCSGDYLATTTVRAKVPAPTTSTSSCINADGSNITISWIDTLPAISYIDISASSTFSPYYHKSVSGTPTDTYGFTGYSSTINGQLLTLEPSTTYHVRSWNNQVQSDSSSFTTPVACSCTVSWHDVPSVVSANTDFSLHFTEGTSNVGWNFGSLYLDDVYVNNTVGGKCLTGADINGNCVLGDIYFGAWEGLNSGAPGTHTLTWKVPDTRTGVTFGSTPATTCTPSADFTTCAVAFDCSTLACHTNTTSAIYANGICGLKSCAPNAPAATSCGDATCQTTTPTYYTGSSCSTTACSNYNAFPEATIPACRTSGGSGYDGSSCTETTYTANCTDTDACTTDSCSAAGVCTHTNNPVNGAWSDWSGGTCVSCGTGTLTGEVRTCTNLTPSCGGTECTRNDGTLTTPADRTEQRSGVTACTGSTTCDSTHYCSSGTCTACPALPAAPTGLSPITGSVLRTAGNTTFSWDAVTGAAGYYFRIAPDIRVPGGTCGTDVYCSDMITSNSISRTLTTGTDYTWWVHNAIAANGSCGTAGPYTPATLHVCSAMTTPTLLSPAGNIDAGTRNITWNRVANATAYSVRVADRTDGSSGDIENCDTCTVDLTPAALSCANTADTTCSYSYNFLSGHNYDIWVHSKVDNNSECWSNVNYLIAKVRPAVSAGPSCIPAGYNGAGYTITWAGSAPAGSYVDISTREDFATYYHKDVSSTTSTNGTDFNLSTGGGTSLTYSGNTPYYVRLYWNYSTPYHSGTASFTTPNYCTPTGSCSVSPTTITTYATDTTTYTATPSGGNGTYTYSWTFNGNTDPCTASSCTKNFSTAGTVSSSLTISSAGLTSSTISCPDVTVQQAVGPWIQAVGDVHSNTGINAPGGP
ncbi:hypothetical protein HY383_03370 [Candidatus Daviesbacteria bacterium]|nr:hypothetical protein [Candidatus Daviesbacteria bacterium]